MKQITRTAVVVNRLILTILLSSGCLLGAGGPRAEFHVSADGSPHGNGSTAAPWDLGTALSHPSIVKPGDTIWVHGGRYRGAFVSRLQGGPEAPIIVRRYPGERAVLTGGVSSDRILEAGGAWTWYWGLEFAPSDATDSSQDPMAPTHSLNPAVTVNGIYIQLINLVLRAGAGGFEIDPSAYGVELYGNIVYQAAAGAAEIRRTNNPFGEFQFPVHTVRLRDNIVFGEPAAVKRLDRSPETPMQSAPFEGNLTYSHSSSIYTVPPGLRALLLGRDQTAAESQPPAGSLHRSRPNLVLFPSGAFPDPGGAAPIVSEARGVRSVIRPNLYEEGRAHVIVYDAGRVALAIDLSKVLRRGDRYEIRDVENFFGSPLLSGRYDGQPVLVPQPRGPEDVVQVAGATMDHDPSGRLRTFAVLPIPAPTAESTDSAIHADSRFDGAEDASLAPRATLQVDPERATRIPSAAGTVSSDAGTGHVLVYRLGENNSRETAPRGGVRLNVSSESAANPRLYNSAAAGANTVSASNVIGLVESVGTCTYPVEGSECTVADYPISPDCNDTTCSVTVSVSANQVTKVVFQYVGVYEGFASTIGGRHGAVIHVTNLQNDGPGSLAAALAEACVNRNRYIVFDVGGEIIANRNLRVCGVNITVDALTAPTPIILRRTGLTVRVIDFDGIDREAHDIIVRGFLIRKDNNGGQDGTQDKAVLIEAGGSSYTGPNRSHQIVFANNSISGSPDDMVVIARETHHVTITGNIISHAGVSNLGFMVLDHSHSISIYNNLLAYNADRNPFITWNNQPPESGDAPSLTADFRNNLIGLTQIADGALASTSAGTSVARGAKANIVNNYYVGLRNLRNNVRAIDNALIVCNPGSNWINPRTSPGLCGETTDPLSFTKAGGAYVSGNVVASAYNAPPTVPLDHWTTTFSPFAAASVTTRSAFSAACRVLSKAGAGPSDPQDDELLQEVRVEVERLGACDALSSPRARSATRRLRSSSAVQ